jgi:hypothetical protein
MESLTVTENSSDIPEWQLTEEAVNSGDADLLVEFRPGKIPAVVHYFGFKPGAALENKEGLKIEDIDHVEAVLLMGPDTFGLTEDELTKISPIIDQVIVRQFMIVTQYDKDGKPLNVGRSVMTKEATAKVLYRNDKPLSSGKLPHWPPDMSKRLERIMRDANPRLTAMAEDLEKYRNNEKV